MPADLHTHSTASDGTDSPAGVVEAAVRSGIDVLALTDHDSVDSWPQARAAATEAGIVLLPGTEFSTTAERVNVHMLSYLHDPADPNLTAEIAKIRTSRTERARRMADLLSADYPVTWDDIINQVAPGAVIGRPHLADALVAAGVVASREQAFDQIIYPGGPYYVRHYATPAAEMIGYIRQAGGVPILAHPAAASRGRILSDDAIGGLAGAGLAGLEVDHRDNPPDQRRRLRALAASLGLLVTGSSDYHGSGKPNRLGENTTAPDVVAAIRAQGHGTEVTEP